MQSTAVMEIMFTSPMGTEKTLQRIERQSRFLHSSEKMSAGRGRDGKRPFGRRVSEAVFFFVNGHSFFLAIGENGSDFSYAMQ